MHHMKYENTMSMFYDKVKNKEYEPLSKDETYQLLNDYQEAWNVEALGKVILTHIRYIVHFCKKYNNYPNLNAEQMDFIQEWVVWLIKAAQKFDTTHEKNTQFLTYATWRIQQRIQEYITTGARFAVSAPVHTYWIVWRVEKIQNSATNSLGESLTFEETAELMGINSNTLYNQIRASAFWVMSFDQPLYDESDRTLADIISDNREEYISEEDQEIYDIILQEARINLSIREYNIFKKRYIDNETMTLEEIAEEENTTRERVRQIEEIALWRILLAIKEKYTDNFFEVDLTRESIIKSKKHKANKNAWVLKIANDLYHKKVKNKEKRKKIQEEWDHDYQKRIDNAKDFEQNWNSQKAKEILQKIEQEKQEKITFSLKEMEILYLIAWEWYITQDAMVKCGLPRNSWYWVKIRLKIAYALFHLARHDPRILTKGSRWTSIPDRETFELFLERYMEQKKTHTPTWVFDILTNYYNDKKDSIIINFDIDEQQLENLRNNALRLLFATPEEQIKITYEDALKKM